MKASGDAGTYTFVTHSRRGLLRLMVRPQRVQYEPGSPGPEHATTEPSKTGNPLSGGGSAAQRRPGGHHTPSHPPGKGVGPQAGSGESGPFGTGCRGGAGHSVGEVGRPGWRGTPYRSGPRQPGRIRTGNPHPGRGRGGAADLPVGDGFRFRFEPRCGSHESVRGLPTAGRGSRVPDRRPRRGSEGIRPGGGKKKPEVPSGF